MKKVLVVDDMAVLREPIAASLRLAKYDAHCAADGEEALRLTRELHPDLVLLNVAMPTMDGITFLKRLRSEPAIAGTHVILLTVVSDKESVLAARSLGVKEYIIKAHFRLDDLLQRIKEIDADISGPVASGPMTEANTPDKPKRAAAHPAPAKGNRDIPRLVSRDEFLERVQHAFEAKTLSGVVAEVIAMASSPRGDTTQLAALISRDPVLSARVLQTANSASYGSSGAVVTTIADAIRKVGYTAVRNLAAALGVFECLPEAGTDGFNPIRCWQHSFAVAQLCERLATKSCADKAGLAYVVGLCHDLGDIFVRTQFSKEYQQVVDLAAVTGRPWDELCGLMLGVTPAQIFSTVHKCMSIPEAIRAPIELLHSPNAAHSDDPLTRILWMAENYANAILLASSANSEVAPMTQTFCRAAVGEPNPPRPEAQGMRTQVLSLTVALARLSRLDEQKLLAPMFKSQNGAVWVAREANISQFDPVGLALESLMKTTISDRLPQNDEAEQSGGLLVIASSVGEAGFSTLEIDSLAKKCRGSGRSFPILTVTARGGTHMQQRGNEVCWRSSLTLSELATFAENLNHCAPARAA